MLRRSIQALARPPFYNHYPYSTMASSTPMEDIMRQKITASLSPTTLEIHNDSHLHAHHKAMQDSTSAETHFRVVITSEAFEKKMQPARHRMVYTLLKEEMAKEGGIHALQLRTRTPSEEENQKSADGEAKKDLEGGGGK
ncbi:bola domain-containing protein [Calycina marina]|uniref:Bola domain-containing protein n=1 Tax=Calycina marina TaxID=1763456 RepID=A0A9P7ZCR9_9HELO|nr:bola domain-containing protein [Calycina marina]